MRDSFNDENIQRELQFIEGPIQEVEWCAPDGLSIDLAIAPTVYPPGEDTGILCDSLSIFGEGNSRRLLEIGCGSGAVSIWAAMRGFNVHTCDINPIAVAALRGRISELGMKGAISVSEGGPGEGDGAWSGQGQYDLIIWNPPYLDPPPSGEPMLGPLEEAGMVDLDWQQGSGDLLLDEIDRFNLLKDDGTVLIIRSSTTIGRHLGRQSTARGWAHRTIEAITFGDGEHLEVLAFWKPWSSRTIEYFTEGDSSNTLLLDQGGNEGRCLQLNIQTKGKGQRGRTWDSQEGDMLASWLVPMRSPGILQLVAGMAAWRAIDSLNEEALMKQNHWLKWPNDILTERGKLSGTLVEARSGTEHGMAVVGIGINLKPRNGPGISHLEVESEILIKRIDAELSSFLEQRIGCQVPNDEKLLSMAWKILSLKLCEGAIISNSNLKGRPVGLDESGRLLVENEHGETMICDTTFDSNWRFEFDSQDSP